LQPVFFSGFDSLRETGEKLQQPHGAGFTEWPHLSTADVLIEDINGEKVLEAVSDSPWFFTKLPTGQYTITATTMGESLHRVIQVPLKGQTEVHFPGTHQL
jgi:hypothetical protein